MHLNIPHTFSKDDAISRVKTMLVQAKSQFSDKLTIEEERWEGDTLHFAFNAQGQQIAGKAEVTDKEFVIDAKLPLMMRLFEGKLERMIQEQTKEMLAKGKPAA
jgi:acid stress-induced BolA-like protein IbaG/YrbA